MSAPIHLHRLSPVTAPSERSPSAEVAPPQAPGDRFEARSLDGSGNHPQDLNQAGSPYARLGPLTDWGGSPNPRALSNALLSQGQRDPDPGQLSGLLWGWGQLIDHDLTFFAKDETSRTRIPVPKGDPHFDPAGTGRASLPYSASRLDSEGRPINEVSAWLDGSMVYGSDPARAAALRTMEGGRLKTSEGDNLPYNLAGLPNEDPLRGAPERLLLAGDIRANENPVLLSLQTILLREHNRQADALSQAHPAWSDEQLYQGARRRVGALIQAITYEEFLPALLGPDPLPPYRGYQPDTDPRLSLEFVTGAYRLGHSQLGETVFRNGPDMERIPEGDLSLRDGYFQPERTLREGGVAATLRGAAEYIQEATDLEITDGVRNFLFGPPGAGGLDLAAMNIRRGREHQLPDIQGMRQTFGLDPITDLTAYTGDPAVARRLEAAYGGPAGIDPWVGLLAERRAPGAAVGETLRRILADQFQRLRDGDRFWYEADPALTGELEAIRGTTLSQLIARNLDGELQPQAFLGTQVEREPEGAA